MNIKVDNDYLYNPITNSYINKYNNSYITNVILSVFDWQHENEVKKQVYKMYYHYKFKIQLKKKDWKNDFLKIVEYYSDSKIKKAHKIIKKIIKEEQLYLHKIRTRNNSSSRTRPIYLETIQEEQLGILNKKSLKQIIKNFLKKYILSNKNKCECSICLNFDSINDKIVELPCKHNYHYNCISNWINISNKCPLCKQHCY